MSQAYAGFEARSAPPLWKARRGGRGVRRRVIAVVPPASMLDRLSLPIAAERAAHGTILIVPGDPYRTKPVPPVTVLAVAPSTGRVLTIYHLTDWADGPPYSPQPWKGTP